MCMVYFSGNRGHKNYHDFTLQILNDCKIVIVIKIKENVFILLSKQHFLNKYLFVQTTTNCKKTNKVNDVYILQKNVHETSCYKFLI